MVDGRQNQAAKGGNIGRLSDGGPFLSAEVGVEHTGVRSLRKGNDGLGVGRSIHLKREEDPF